MSVQQVSQEQLTEHADWRGAAIRINREAGIILDVKILGLASKNGRVYRRDALGQSIPLYEGARVNVNHPRGGPHAPRDYEERIGSVRNVRLAGDGLYGDFHFNPRHRLAEQLLWDAEHTPENVGFSHNVLARTAFIDGRTVVEAITKVQSVDLVADPATTRGLFEAQTPSAKSQSNTNRPSIWDNASGSWVPLKETPAISAQRESVAPSAAKQLHLLEEENRALREEVRDLQRREAEAAHRAAADAAIATAGVPKVLDTELFRLQCYQAEGEQALARLIEARLEDAQLLRGSGRPRSIEQTREAASGATVVDGASFAAAIR